MHVKAPSVNIGVYVSIFQILLLENIQKETRRIQNDLLQVIILISENVSSSKIIVILSHNNIIYIILVLYSPCIICIWFLFLHHVIVYPIKRLNKK